MILLRKRYIWPIISFGAIAAFSSPFIVASVNIKETKHQLYLDVEYDVITEERLLITVPPELYDGQKITVTIANFYNRTISMTGYPNNATIVHPGQSEKITIFEWAEMMYRMTPRGRA